MALTAVDYTKVITEDLAAIPENYLPILANLVHSFKESVTYMPPLSDAEQAALALGVEQADNDEFASEDDVAAVFGKWGVDVKS